MSTKARALAVVRTVLVVIGAGGALLVAYSLATMPAPPPDSDGFIHGGALLYGGIIVVLGLGMAALGVALPTLVGTADPLGFGRWQRRVLKAALVVAGGGLLVGLAVGFLTELQFGLGFWFLCIVLAIGLVCIGVLWRLGEAVVGTVSRRLTR